MRNRRGRVVAIIVGAMLGLCGCFGGGGGSGMGVLVPKAGGDGTTVVTLPKDWATSTVKALRESPGCLGVEAGRMVGGKVSIFAMFRDKASAVAWYHSPEHQKLLGLVSSYRTGGHEPLKAVDDGQCPIMVIATMTPTSTSSRTVNLSVELFRPLEGGVGFNGASFLPR